ncbi:MAG: riboflavin biosynthesis protein RibF [Nitrospirae bacterium]|nr:riboflavin biosynthesis protein RibF [Nitrospirota bacterium]MDA1302984.1 riboflavin biosynthesis protein RibF [Nitrospirota bacterium]
MKVSRGLPTIPLPPHPVLTIGNFDGQHLGHRYLLSTVINCARESGGTPMVLTFDPHPVQVLNPKVDFQFLTSPEEKLTWFESVGVEHLVILEFTKAFAALSPEEFVQSILHEGLGVRDLFVGEHFVFGKGRAGNTATLTRLGKAINIQVHLLKPLGGEDRVMSSTRIRNMIQLGEMDAARECLGRAYSLQGAVVEGAQRGEALGCRTANLQLPPGRVIPPDGVYVTRVMWKGEAFNSISYIGTRPTFGPGERLLEVHLLDEACVLYGENIQVSFLKYLRGDEVFETSEALAARIALDIDLAREVLGKEGA